MNKQDFIRLAYSFLDDVFARIRSEKIPLQPHWSIDHLCFRTSSLSRYHHHQALFSQWGDFLVESEVNGRPISTFKLRDPFHYQGRFIDLVELPAPKQGKSTREGFEHLEVVCDLPFHELQKDLPRDLVEASGLRKNFNQELEVDWKGCAVKYHHLSLESVINVEKNQRVFSSLVQSRVLELLRPYRPLVCGTFPLGLALSSSDVDILLTSPDLDSLAGEMTNLFGTFEEFELFREMEDGKEGEEALVTRFTYQGVPFELFAQHQESIRQTAYRHFQVEERLLKVGGEKFHQAVRQSRTQGAKTEEAFARVLGLAGDPYQRLLDLHGESEGNLAEITGDFPRTRLDVISDT